MPLKKTIFLLFLTTHNYMLSDANSSSTTTYKKGCSLVTIGRFTYAADSFIGKSLDIKEWSEGASLSIGQFTSIAHNVTIFLGGNHRTDWITTFPFGHINNQDFGSENIVGHPATKGDVVIGNDVWIGDGATIFSGVTIGDGAVIAARSVVVKNVAPYSIVAGNPARHIRFRFDENIRTLLIELRWWDLEISEIKEITSKLCSYPDVDMLNLLLTQFRLKT